jgi:cell division protein FtsZ
MEQVQRHINDHARMHLGVSADDRFGDRLEVTIISATGSDPVEPAQKPVRRTPVASVVATPAPQRDAVPAPSLFGAIGADDDDDVHSGGKKAKVEQMQFEPVSRGRFEKSEPTIVDGQDLDIPTFLRKGFRLK